MVLDGIAGGRPVDGQLVITRPGHEVPCAARQVIGQVGVVSFARIEVIAVGEVIAGGRYPACVERIIARAGVEVNLLDPLQLRLVVGARVVGRGVRLQVEQVDGDVLSRIGLGRGVEAQVERHPIVALARDDRVALVGAVDPVIAALRDEAVPAADGIEDVAACAGLDVDLFGVRIVEVGVPVVVDVGPVEGVGRIGQQRSGVERRAPVEDQLVVALTGHEPRETERAEVGGEQVVPIGCVEVVALVENVVIRSHTARVDGIVARAGVERELLKALDVRFVAGAGKENSLRRGDVRQDKRDVLGRVGLCRRVETQVEVGPVVPFARNDGVALVGAVDAVVAALRDEAVAAAHGIQFVAACAGLDVDLFDVRVVLVDVSEVVGEGPVEGSARVRRQVHEVFRRAPVEDQPVIARARGEHGGPERQQIGGEGVVAIAGIEGVRGIEMVAAGGDAARVQEVVARPGGQADLLDPLPAGFDRGARIDRDRPVLRIGKPQRDVEPEVHVVCRAYGRVDEVMPRPAGHVQRAAIAVQPVVAAVAVQRVVEVAADQGVRSGAAPQVEGLDAVEVDVGVTEVVDVRAIIGAAGVARVVDGSGRVGPVHPHDVGGAEVAVDVVRPQRGQRQPQVVVAVVAVHHGASARTRDDRVVAVSAADGVAVGVAGDPVVQRVAGDRHGAGVVGDGQILDPRRLNRHVEAARPGREQLDQVVAVAVRDRIQCVVDDVGVVSAAADHRVLSGEAVQPVVARRAGKGVVERVAGRGAGCAEEGQVLDVLLARGVERPVHPGVDKVGAGADLGHLLRGVVNHVGVVAIAADQRVRVRPAVEAVVAGAAPERVAARRAQQRVTAAKPVEFVVGVVADQRVAVGGAFDLFDADIGVALGIAAGLGGLCQVDQYRRGRAPIAGPVASGAAEVGIRPALAFERVVAVSANQRLVERVAGQVAVGHRVVDIECLDVVPGVERKGRELGDHRVGAVPGGLDDLVAQVVDHVGIVAAEADHAVGTGLAVQPLARGRAVQRVVARSAVKRSAGQCRLVRGQHVVVVVARAGDGAADQGQVLDLVLAAGGDGPADRRAHFIHAARRGADRPVSDLAVAVLVHHVAGIVDVVHVIAHRADHGVRAGAAVQRVGTLRSQKHVVAPGARDGIVAQQADEHLVPGAAGQRVAVVGALKHLDLGQAVALGAAAGAVPGPEVHVHPGGGQDIGHHVLPIAADDGVGTVAAIEQVVADPAGEVVVAVASEERIVAVAAFQRVVPGAARQHVVAGIARKLCGDGQRLGQHKLVALRPSGRKQQRDAAVGLGIAVDRDGDVAAAGRADIDHLCAIRGVADQPVARERAGVQGQRATRQCAQPQRGSGGRQRRAAGKVEVRQGELRCLQPEKVAAQHFRGQRQPGGDRPGGVEGAERVGCDRRQELVVVQPSRFALDAIRDVEVDRPGDVAAAVDAGDIGVERGAEVDGGRDGGLRPGAVDDVEPVECIQNGCAGGGQSACAVAEGEVEGGADGPADVDRDAREDRQVDQAVAAHLEVDRGEVDLHKVGVAAQ